VRPEDLIDIEQIKQLKARYFRFMDAKRWDAWADVFTEDCHLQVENGPGVPQTDVAGRDAIVAYVSHVLEGVITTHHGHMPEIEITGPDSARGIWAMYDYLTGPVSLKGYGHYHETYRRDADGRWRIASLDLRRIRVDAPESW